MDKPGNEKPTEEKVLSVASGDTSAGADKTEYGTASDKPAEQPGNKAPDIAARKAKHLKLFGVLLIICWVIVILGALCVWQYVSMKNTAGYLKTDTKNLIRSFAALDSNSVDINIAYIDEDLQDFNRLVDNPFWKAAGFVFKQDIGSAKLLASSLEKASDELFVPAAELLKTCPPVSSEAAVPWLELYDRLLPSVCELSDGLNSVSFRFYDKDGKLRGYIDELAYITKVLVLADDDFVTPGLKLLAGHPLGGLKTEGGYDFDTLGLYLDFIADAAPGLAETMKSISPEDISALDPGGRLNSLCSQAASLADYGVRLAGSVVAPVSQMLQSQPLSGLKIDDGFNAVLIRNYAEMLEEILPKARELTGEFYALDLSALDRDGKITGIVDKISALLEAYEPAEKYLPLLKVLMGSGEDRTYIFPVQNSSELRASGGFPGSVGLITVRGGVLSFGKFSGVHSYFTMYCGKRYGITEEEKDLFSQNMILTWDACYCPDFERAGQIFAYAAEDKLRIPIDGTVSMTPAILQDVLKIFGDITVFDGSVLNGDNATRIIQRDVYFWYYPFGSTNNLYAADSYFGDCAKKTMELVRDNLDKDSILQLVDLFREGSADRRIMLWMADPDEQEIVKAAGCSGGLNHDAENPQAGIYVSGFSACKLGWWLGVWPEIGEPEVNADGSRTYDVTVTVENTLTWDEYNRASVDFITSGDGTYDLYTHFFAPEGGSISDFSASSQYWYNRYVYQGLEDIRTVYYLSPGGRIVFSYKITTAPGVDTPLTLSMTPTLQEYW